MMPATTLSSRSFNLTYLESFNIKDGSEGLSEPSGLALSHGKNALWTISDDTKKIFKLSITGKLKKKASLKLPDKGLEGIVLDPTGQFLLAVKEESNEIIKINIETEQIVDRNSLASMAGYTAVSAAMDGSANKGLEGIAWNQATGTIFVIKEGDPGLIIEISSDLKTIQSHHKLNSEHGFRDNEVEPDQIDFSDICYDPSREKFWIISDRAKRLFLYDWKSHTVLQTAKLSYGEKGKYREIEKAEGVAIDPDANRLYIVSDQDLYLTHK